VNYIHSIMLTQPTLDLTTTWGFSLSALSAALVAAVPDALIWDSFSVLDLSTPKPPVTSFPRPLNRAWKLKELLRSACPHTAATD
jgi:hypothetical protein